MCVSAQLKISVELDGKFGYIQVEVVYIYPLDIDTVA